MPHAVGLKNLLSAFFAYAASRPQDARGAAEFVVFLLREFFAVEDECLERLVKSAESLHPVALAELAARVNRASRIRRPVDWCDALRDATIQTTRLSRRTRDADG